MFIPIYSKAVNLATPANLGDIRKRLERAVPVLVSDRL